MQEKPSFYFTVGLVDGILEKKENLAEDKEQYTGETQHEADD